MAESSRPEEVDEYLMRRFFPNINRRIEKFADIAVDQGLGAALRYTAAYVGKVSMLRLRQVKDFAAVMLLRAEYGERFQNTYAGVGPSTLEEALNFEKRPDIRDISAGINYYSHESSEASKEIAELRKE